MCLNMNLMERGRRALTLKSHELTACAALAAISAALQIVHVGWASPWGMWIDVVAVSWIVAYFIYGGRPALVVSLVGALIITIAAPSTWLGAMVKWTATLPMILVPEIVRRAGGFGIRGFRKPALLVAAIAGGVLLRGVLIIPMNYYFALPIWTGWTPEQAMSFIPWWIIFGLNAVQGALEVAIAWLLVFRFKLNRFAQ